MGAGASSTENFVASEIDTVMKKVISCDMKNKAIKVNKIDNNFYKKLKSAKSLQSLALMQRSRQENSYIPQESLLSSHQLSNNKSRYMSGMLSFHKGRGICIYIYWSYT